MKFSRRELITNLFKHSPIKIPVPVSQEDNVVINIGTLNEFPVGTIQLIHGGLIEIISNEYGIIAQAPNSSTYYGLLLVAGQIYLEKKKQFKNLHYLSIMTGEMCTM